jgi:hypothetical protein
MQIARLAQTVPTLSNRVCKCSHMRRELPESRTLWIGGCIMQCVIRILFVPVE